jgi:hypothetical protein
MRFQISNVKLSSAGHLEYLLRLAALSIMRLVTRPERGLEE